MTDQTDTILHTAANLHFADDVYTDHCAKCGAGIDIAEGVYGVREDGEYYCAECTRRCANCTSLCVRGDESEHGWSWDAEQGEWYCEQCKGDVI